MKVYQVDNGIHIKSWCLDPDDKTLEQCKNAARLPFVSKHISLMPDAHFGYGIPIGGVVATEKVIVPNLCGVDIGCGVAALRTSLKVLDKETIKKIFGGSKEYKGGIRTYVPVGFNHHSKAQDESLLPSTDNINSDSAPIVNREIFSALKQIGTLGGGNHFIELQKGNDGFVWIMIHSGSRNLGFRVANHYNKIATELNAKWYSSVPEKHGLAFLPLDSEEGQCYLTEMNFCVDFALANREAMLTQVKRAISEIVSDVTFGTTINIAHNYAAMENHYNQNVMVHRKGATRAYQGQLGIIPGSQGTCSYIVSGKGNTESFQSCSHGAGRRLGRKEACRSLNLEEEIEKLDRLGIVHGLRTKADLEEAAGAYKNIDEVMINQEDLVDIQVQLIPLAVIKG